MKPRRLGLPLPTVPSFRATVSSQEGQNPGISHSPPSPTHQLCVTDAYSMAVKTGTSFPLPTLLMGWRLYPRQGNTGTAIATPTPRSTHRAEILCRERQAKKTGATVLAGLTYHSGKNRTPSLSPALSSVQEHRGSD